MSDSEEENLLSSESEPEPGPLYESEQETSGDPIYAIAPTIHIHDEGSVDVATSPAFQCLDEVGDSPFLLVSRLNGIVKSEKTSNSHHFLITTTNV